MSEVYDLYDYWKRVERDALKKLEVARKQLARYALVDQIELNYDERPSD